LFTPSWTSLRSPREAPALSPSWLDLWLVDLDHPPPSIIGLLDAEERARAERFVHDRDARRFAATRGALRFVLGAYLERGPEEIAFELGPWGKPALASPSAVDFSFNLAHSGGHALIGVGLAASLGVDLEAMRPIDDWRDLAEHTFAPGEARSVIALPPTEQMDGFFACWSRKEAVIKYWGEGLSADLQSFEVSTHPAEPARLISTTRPATRASDIRLWSFKPVADAWAAVAAPATPQKLSLRYWRLS